MKQFIIATSIFVIPSLLSQTTFAQLLQENNTAYDLELSITQVAVQNGRYVSLNQFGSLDNSTDGPSNAPDWNYERNESTQATNDDGGGIDKLLYYEIKVNKVHHTHVEPYVNIKMLKNAIVFQDFGNHNFEGIFLSTIGSNNMFQSIGFNDESFIISSLERFSSSSKTTGFYNQFGDRLDGHISLGDWQNDIQDFLDNYDLSSLSPCNSAIIQVLRALNFQEQANNAGAVYTILDEVFRKQETFRNACDQDLARYSE